MGEAVSKKRVVMFCCSSLVNWKLGAVHWSPLDFSGTFSS
jgi:hypothetical protein